MEATGSPSRRVLVGGLAVLALLALGVGVWKTVGPGDDEERERGLGDYRCTDPSKAYYGNVAMIRRPGVVRSDDVFARIPEYREIRSKGLTDKAPRYHFLMKKASERFTGAVAAAARAGGYDFVSETGTIQVEDPEAPPPADLTQDVIARLE